jgi:hypothetical protein
MITEVSLQERIEGMDWDHASADTQYLTHSIHRYSGKFIPQIARQAIELLTALGDLVLDPYCGSGTTLLESSLTGRRSIGVDLNPLAVLISRVKTTPVKKHLLTDFLHELKHDLQPLLSPAKRGNLTQQNFLYEIARADDTWKEQACQDFRWKDEWYVKWFQDEIRLELIAINQRIMTEPREELRNIALVAFSDILRKSSNAHGSYPNVMFDKNRGVPPPATPRFISRLEEVAQAVVQLEDALDGKPLPVVTRANNRCLTLQPESVDAVITHPPYIGSIPYAEYGVLSITWLGHDPKQLDRELTGGKRQSSSVVEQFREGYSDMIKEAFRVLKRGRTLLVLVGNPVVKGKRIDLAEMSKEFALKAGFTVAAAHQRNGINRRANLMGHEDLLLFQKL